MTELSEYVNLRDIHAKLITIATKYMKLAVTLHRDEENMRTSITWKN